MHRVDNATATPGGFSQTGDTTVSSPVITNIPSTVNVNIGDYVTVDFGFSYDKGMRIIAKNASSITVERNADSSQVGSEIASLGNLYTDGVPGVTPRTAVGSKSINTIQEELCNILENSSVALSDVNNKQLSGLLLTKVGDQVVDGKLTAKELSTPIISGPLGSINFSDLVILTDELNVAGKANLNAIINSIAGSDTDIDGDELETLSNGSNADGLHKHVVKSFINTFIKYNIFFSPAIDYYYRQQTLTNGFISQQDYPLDGDIRILANEFTFTKEFGVDTLNVQFTASSHTTTDTDDVIRWFVGNKDGVIDEGFVASGTDFTHTGTDFTKTLDISSASIGAELTFAIAMNCKIHASALKQVLMSKLHVFTS